jgi:hypothetical protein
MKGQFCVEEKQKGGKHDFKQGSIFLLVENMGQVVVQDGRSVDHGASGSPSSFFSVNSSFQAGKWVVNHIQNSTTLKLPAYSETSYTECMETDL